MKNETLGHHLNLNWWQFALIVIVVFILINRLQKMRFRRKGLTDEMYRTWHDDPKNWKAGLFYYNPQDPRILPPKRIAWTGWTINFANPLSIIGVIVLLVFVFMLLTYVA